jgi:2-C-methyl-D-erythritol 4-phosphate cytidylyltransferase / 2-C-methyl-D-erythritol 2,4-cyclodiphosphate synthase
MLDRNLTKTATVIVAAGRGLRAESAFEGPKQFAPIGAETVLAKSIAAFESHEEISVIQPVIHAGDRARYEDAVPGHDRIEAPVIGGSTRQESVYAGLAALAEYGVERVLVHDAARPFVDHRTITDVLNAIDSGVCALPATPQSDTLKRVDGNGFVVETIPRQNLYCAQTPQGFRFAEIFAAHEMLRKSGRNDCSDDAQVAELAGLRVRVVPSSAANVKLTTAEELKSAIASAGPGAADLRSGNGYDVHVLVPGDGLMLCGVKIPYDRRLEGHSDADVGLHALTDALLGAMALEDIGAHFPPSEDKWRGASSDTFLRHAAGLVSAAGGVITNLDVTLLCEAPKLAPYRQAMRGRIAAIAGVEISRVSVKATTSEGLGFIGRGEGIAAFATATVLARLLRHMPVMGA